MNRQQRRRAARSPRSPAPAGPISYPFPRTLCRHDLVRVRFDPEAAARLSADEVRRRWPRYEGVCPGCGAGLVAYASSGHYISGDW